MYRTVTVPQVSSYYRTTGKVGGVGEGEGGMVRRAVCHWVGV